MSRYFSLLACTRLVSSRAILRARKLKRGKSKVQRFIMPPAEGLKGKTMNQSMTYVTGW